MVFADGYFVVSDRKYVSFKDGVPHLTAAAKRNLAACTLNICEQHVVSYQIAEKDYQGYACLYHASSVDQRMLSFHPTYQSAFKEYLRDKEWQARVAGKKSDISKVTDEDVYKAVADSIFTEYDEHEMKFIKMLFDPYTSLCQALWYWFENHGLTYPSNFYDATRLHTNYHGDIKNNKKNDMNKETLMSVCVGCKFDLRMTERVFRKRGLPLDEFQEPDKTYLMILEHLPGLSISDFNKLLKQKKLKELGTKSKGARKQNPKEAGK